MQRFEIRSREREQMIDITSHVSAAIAESRVTSGLVLVYCPHTTAGITINENADPDVVRDLLDGLGRLVPRDANWRHSEGNSDAHLKGTLVGASVTIPVSEGRLALGTWQGVYFCEFDGPRTRSVSVTVMPPGELAERAAPRPGG